VLFNEPKLLKLEGYIAEAVAWGSFSALQRAEIAEIHQPSPSRSRPPSVSVLFNEPKLLKYSPPRPRPRLQQVSVLFNEPKLLKFGLDVDVDLALKRFSALQRAEIAEIVDERQRRLAYIGVFQCSSTSRNC